MRLFAALLGLGLASGVASAADAGGKFMITGEGAATCSVFNEVFNKGDSAGISKFAAWAHGYAAALNETLNGTYNVLGAKTLDEFIVDVALACQTDNTQPLHDAVRATLTAYYPDRIQVAP
ncbi:hypothetical protein sos41_24630 [Alphaproteobacteria bacterium SO-S41]|nr:hypothetical protein sos41_24630 [Alphaproteobacteria bacterium SO-S41]